MEVTIQSRDKVRMQAVIKFADHVLLKGEDCYRKDPTPLFADGLDIHTGKHLSWTVPGSRKIILSNLASQQILLRVLTGLSNLLGEEVYQEAGVDGLNYHFNYLADRSGLLQWGGHRLIDLKTLAVDGPDNKGLVHEFKNHFPFYSLMFEVNPVATTKFIEAFWNAHLYDWENLETSRHGQYGLEIGDLWEHSFADPPPFRATKGLSFLRTGNDLIYAACLLYKYTGKRAALIWGKRLAKMYYKARHPKTRLGVYQYTQPLKTREAPTDPADPSFTHSYYGDRAQRQFGPEFGPQALEGNMLLSRQARSIYVTNTLMELELAEELGIDTLEFIDWVHEGMLAYAKHAYLPETNMLKPLLADGTDLSDYLLPRSGYFGKKGTVYRQFPAGGDFLYAYARTYRLTGDKDLWKVVRNIARALGLGDLGVLPGQKEEVNLGTDNSDYNVLFALLEIFKTIPDQDYLDLARVVGDNILHDKFHHGYFLNNSKSRYANFSAIEPLALLALEAAIRGTFELVPGYLAAGYLAGDYEYPDGTVRSIYADQIFRK